MSPADSQDPDPGAKPPSLFAAERELARRAAERGAELAVDLADYQQLHAAFLGLLNKADKIVRISDASQRKLRATREQLQQALHDLRQTQERLVRQERLSALGQMARGIAHDFNNALQPIVLGADMLADDLITREPDAVRQLAAEIRQAAASAVETVRRLVGFYRAQSVSGETRVAVNELLRAVAEVTRPVWKDEAQAGGKTIQMNLRLGPEIFLDGYAEDLRDALVNLVLNARDAIPVKGAITLSGRQDGCECVIEVRDDGVGMTDEVRARCLEPFYTTKKIHGSGLGLSIVYGVMQRHGGRLEIATAPDRGTTVTLRLPAASPLPAAEPSAASEPVAAGVSPPAAPRRLLIADDEPQVLAFLRLALERAGHQVWTAPNGRAALDLFMRAPPDLVITDQAMPEMSGEQLARAIKTVAPATPVIMLTGYADLMLAEGRQPPEVDLLLAKPVSLPRLFEAIQEVAPRARPA